MHYTGICQRLRGRLQGGPAEAIRPGLVFRVDLEPHRSSRGKNDLNRGGCLFGPVQGSELMFKRPWELDSIARPTSDLRREEPYWGARFSDFDRRSWNSGDTGVAFEQKPWRGSARRIDKNAQRHHPSSCRPARNLSLVDWPSRLGDHRLLEVDAVVRAQRRRSPASPPQGVHAFWMVGAGAS